MFSIHDVDIKGNSFGLTKHPRDLIAVGLFILGVKEGGFGASFPPVHENVEKKSLVLIVLIFLQGFQIYVYYLVKAYRTPEK